ncbi:hypothetical protein L9F63_014476, partial [Diploptera punctata]
VEVLLVGWFYVLCFANILFHLCFHLTVNLTLANCTFNKSENSFMLHFFVLKIAKIPFIYLFLLYQQLYAIYFSFLSPDAKLVLTMVVGTCSFCLDYSSC